MGVDEGLHPGRRRSGRAGAGPAERLADEASLPYAVSSRLATSTRSSRSRSVASACRSCASTAVRRTHMLVGSVAHVSMTGVATARWSSSTWPTTWPASSSTTSRPRGEADDLLDEQEQVDVEPGGVRRCRSRATAAYHSSRWVASSTSSSAAASHCARSAKLCSARIGAAAPSGRVRRGRRRAGRTSCTPAARAARPVADLGERARPRRRTSSDHRSRRCSSWRAGSVGRPRVHRTGWSTVLRGALRKPKRWPRDWRAASPARVSPLQTRSTKASASRTWSASMPACSARSRSASTWQATSR